MWTYDWETCLIATDEWTRMIKRRNEEGWEMVSADVVSFHDKIIAYVFWKKLTRSGVNTWNELGLADNNNNITVPKGK